MCKSVGDVRTRGEGQFSKRPKERLGKETQLKRLGLKEATRKMHDRAYDEGAS